MIFRLTVLLTFLAAGMGSSAWAGDLKVVHHEKEGRFRVELDGELFTQLIYSGHRKPILYPVHGPYGIAMTRHFPMVKGVKGENQDHPHHTSIFFTHGDVNGVDFWHKEGRIVLDEVVQAGVEDGEARIMTRNKWMKGKKVVCRDLLEIRCGTDRGGRFIDFKITLHASEGPLTFGDTKEGTMGSRTHPALRLKTGAAGVNSEGVTGKAVWGKKARWVDYSGMVEGKRIGVAVFDHPSNLRHPTTWHARDYGLLSANPFGLSSFLGRKHDGTFKLDQDARQTFNYRFLFHKGDVADADIAERYAAWAKKPR
jgi:hypothetical protein